MQPFELPDFYSPWPARLNPNLEAADMALACAIIYPDTSISELNITACWIVWGTYADDYLPALFHDSHALRGNIKS